VVQALCCRFDNYGRHGSFKSFAHALALLLPFFLATLSCSADMTRCLYGVVCRVLSVSESTSLAPLLPEISLSTLRTDRSSGPRSPTLFERISSPSGLLLVRPLSHTTNPSFAAKISLMTGLSSILLAAARALTVIAFFVPFVFICIAQIRRRSVEDWTGSTMGILTSLVTAAVFQGKLPFPSWCLLRAMPTLALFLERVQSSSSG
jgi:hypothetical protein